MVLKVWAVEGRDRGVWEIKLGSCEGGVFMRVR